MLLSLSLLVAIAAAFTVPRDTPSNGWAGKEIESLVTFGDSYTDEQRVNYCGSNNGTAPPVGWIEPVVCLLSFLSSYVGVAYSRLRTKSLIAFGAN